MSEIVTLTLDLLTPHGRAAMRAYIDALDPELAGGTVSRLSWFQRGYDEGRRDAGREEGAAGTSAAMGPERSPRSMGPLFKTDEVTGGEQPAGEEAEAPPPVEVAETSFPPRQAQSGGGGGSARTVVPVEEATGPGVALPRCGGSEGADARPQQSPQAKPVLPPAGVDEDRDAASAVDVHDAAGDARQGSGAAPDAAVEDPGPEDDEDWTPERDLELVKHMCNRGKYAAADALGCTAPECVARFKRLLPKPGLDAQRKLIARRRSQVSQ